MIVDNIKNINNYSFQSQNIAEAIQFLKDINLENINDGRTIIKRKEIFVITSEYIPKKEKEIYWEAHEDYIDIQYIVQGEELIGYAKIDEFEVAVPYGINIDVVLGNANGCFIEMKTGDFMVLFPGDVHKPGIISEEQCRVKKIVIKIKIVDN